MPTSTQAPLPPALQYVSDSEEHPISVIVPIDLWEEMQQELRSERETAYLFSNETMRRRLLEAQERSNLALRLR